jgi:hypothetical protein
MARGELFLTFKEADFIADMFKDAKLGSFEWNIYDRTHKVIRHFYWRDRYKQDIYITHEQADYIADLLKDSPLAGLANNVYEKCRKRAAGQLAFVSNQWR